MRVTIFENIKKYNITVNQQVNSFRVQIKPNTITQRITIASLGKQGLSAYEIAVQEGFVGTIEDWQNSLKGKIIIQDLPELP